MVNNKKSVDRKLSTTMRTKKFFNKLCVKKKVVVQNIYNNSTKIDILSSMLINYMNIGAAHIRYEGSSIQIIRDSSWYATTGLLLWQVVI